MNWAIFGAILFQAFVASVSRIAGAIVGFIITTGVLLWGLAAYADGYAIAYGPFELSQGVFLLACLAWYVYDGKQAYEALTAPPAPKPAAREGDEPAPQA